VLRRIGMGSLLVLFCNVPLYVTDFSYSSLSLHDLCPSVVSDIDFMINLLCYYMLCLVKDLVLVNFYMLVFVCLLYYDVCPSEGWELRLGY